MLLLSAQRASGYKQQWALLATANGHSTPTRWKGGVPIGDTGASTTFHKTYSKEDRVDKHALTALAHCARSDRLRTFT